MRPAELMALLRSVQGTVDGLRLHAARASEPSSGLAQTLDDLRTTSAQLRAIQDAVFDQTASLENQTVLLDAERRRSSEIFHKLPAACLMTDSVGRVLHANPALHTLLGRAEGTVVGQPLALFVDEVDRERWRVLFGQASADAQVRGTFPIRVGGRPTSLRFTGTGLAYQAIRETLWMLEATEALLLSPDGSATEEGSLEGGPGEEFLALLGHELRNPLAPIRAVVDLWRLEGPRLSEDDRRSTVDILARQTDQLARLVDDILDTSRIKHGKLRVRTDVVELNQVVSQSCDAVRAVAHQHRLEVEIPPTPIRVSGDGVRLRQVLVNLLQNAIKFTPPGGRIRVLLSVVDNRAVVDVSDDGIGIARDQLGGVFGSFVQIEENLARSPDGLGLGLALVRRLVELHRGTVSVDSAGPRRGTTFRVALPRIRGRTTAEAARRDALQGMAPLRLLVVDDNIDTTRMLARLLECHGHVVTQATDGVGALEAFAAVPTDAVLLDLGLPDIDGTQVARRMVEMDPGAHVIAVTGYAGERASERVRAAGFASHLLKPVEPEALRRALDQITPRRPGRSGGPAD